MPSTTFLIVRHAESAANAGAYFASQTDSPLTPRGEQQASRLAQALRTSHFDAIYSSDLLRCRDTIAPIAAGRSPVPIESPLLRERHMGAYTGLSFDAARASDPTLWQRIVSRHPDAAPAGGESLREHSARTATFLDGLVDRHEGHTVLLGSHGVTIQHLIRLLMGVDDLTVPIWFVVDNASVSRIEVHGERNRRHGRLVYANRVVALDGDPPPF